MHGPLGWESVTETLSMMGIRRRKRKGRQNEGGLSAHLIFKLFQQISIDECQNAHNAGIGPGPRLKSVRHEQEPNKRWRMR